MRLHRLRHPQPPYGRDVAPGGCRHRCRLARRGRRIAGGAPWLDVRARTRLRRRLRERADAGLPDVPVRPRATGHGRAGAHRRSLIISSGVAVLLGVIEAGSVWQAIATIPEFFWELSLGIWLTVKGFNSSVIASEKFRLRPTQA